MSEATIVLGDETYLFQQVADGGRVCNPSGGGGTFFRVMLTRVDESGNQMVSDPGDEEFIWQVDIALILEDLAGPDSGIVLFSQSDSSWFAQSMEDGRSGIDSVSIEGNYAHGTATFVRTPGEDPVSGTFEVICADN